MEPTRKLKSAFVLGLATGGVSALLIAALAATLGVRRLGLKSWSREAGRFAGLTLWGREGEALDMPKDVLADLTAMRAVIENAGNPTRQPAHDTILVCPDEALRYVLRPNAKIEAHVLPSARPIDFDPPLLHVSQAVAPTPRVRAYLDRQSRRRVCYTVDSRGLRTVLPRVSSARQVLVVGDSVAFGVGVNDEDTIASCLQREVGGRFEIMNAGVGGYNGRQCVLAAAKLSQGREFAGLIYVACQNDFGYVPSQVGEVLDRLHLLRDRFGGRAAVVFHAYMEFCMEDFFLDRGLSPARLARTREIRAAVRSGCEKHGFAYVDWPALVAEHAQAEGSLMARFALYADHCHLSRLGASVLARKLAEPMAGWE